MVRGGVGRNQTIYDPKEKLSRKLTIRESFKDIRPEWWTKPRHLHRVVHPPCHQPRVGNTDMTLDNSCD